MTARLQGVRVLVVEDDEPTRIVLERVLEQYGATVTSARDPAAALDLLEVAPDLALVDLNLNSGARRQEGLTLLRWARQRPEFQHTAIVLTSAYVEELPSELEGCDAILPKPFVLDELPELLAQAIAQRARVAPVLPDTEASSGSCS